MQDPLLGTTLGRYQIVERIGTGGMATVYKAYQPDLNRHVAVKIMSGRIGEDDTRAERFRREALAVAQLEHPNILAIHDVGEQGDRRYIVMPLVTGGTLKDRVGAPLPLEWTLRICSQVADALDHAHAHGIVHRDVKPSNILLAPGDRALLADFGIARLENQPDGLTRTGTGIGSPEYVSPEQAYGLPADGRSDQYSLAVTVFEMLAGVAPYSGETPLALAFKHINDPVPNLADVVPSAPSRINAVLQRALAKNPDDRFLSAGAFALALGEAAGLGPLPAATAPLEPAAHNDARGARRPPRGLVTAVLAAALLLVVGAVGTFALRGAGLDLAASPTSGVDPFGADNGIDLSDVVGGTPTGADARVRLTAIARIQFVAEIADLGCTAVSGRVTADGRPVRDYLLNISVASPGAAPRLVANALAVAGPEFRFELPARLPAGTSEIRIEARKGPVRTGQPARASVSC